MNLKLLFFLFLFSFSEFIFCQGDSILKIKIRTNPSFCQCSRGLHDSTGTASLRVEIFVLDTIMKNKFHGSTQELYQNGNLISCQSFSDSISLFKNLKAGIYDIVVCSKGFVMKRMDGLNLSVGKEKAVFFNITKDWSIDNAPLKFKEKKKSK